MDQDSTAPRVVNDNADVYYTGHYWNDLSCVRERINSRISGNPHQSWQVHLGNRYGSFQRALSLNCGNGWVERELVQRGIASEAVGVDYSRDLLAEAESAATAAGLPITYEQVDINQASFPADGFDLVINHAAGHHIAHIDRVFRYLCEHALAHTRFISFDYVGPHRNQYSYEAWEYAWNLNRKLPEHVQQDMTYPSLETMLHDDPTEAIHSELIESTIRRYFKVERFVPLGGAIAYPLLTHNRGLFRLADPVERERWAEYIMKVDDEYLENHPESTLFAYIEATPAKEALSDPDRLTELADLEIARERAAAERGGHYYDPSPYQAAVAELYARRHEVQTLQATVMDLESRLQAQGSVNTNPGPLTLKSALRRAGSGPRVKRLRANRRIAALETAMRKRMRS